MAGKALIQAEKKLLLEPTNTIALEEKGEALFQLEEYEQALDVYKMLLHIDTNNTRASIRVEEVRRNISK
jgi:tetratricopeptide (TPR) repeat protein